MASNSDNVNSTRRPRASRSGASPTKKFFSRLRKQLVSQPVGGSSRSERAPPRRTPTVQLDHSLDELDEAQSGRSSPLTVPKVRDDASPFQQRSVGGAKGPTPELSSDSPFPREEFYSSSGRHFEVDSDDDTFIPDPQGRVGSSEEAEGDASPSDSVVSDLSEAARRLSMESPDSREVVYEDDEDILMRFQDCGKDAEGREVRYDVRRHMMQFRSGNKWVDYESFTSKPVVHPPKPSTPSPYSQLPSTLLPPQSPLRSPEKLLQEELREFRAWKAQQGNRVNPSSPLNPQQLFHGTDTDIAFPRLPKTPLPSGGSPWVSSSSAGDGSVHRNISASDTAKLFKAYRDRIEKEGKKLTNQSSNSAKALVFLTMKDQISHDAVTYNPGDPSRFASDAFQDLVPSEMFQAFFLRHRHRFSSDLSTQVTLFGIDLFKVMLAKTSASELLLKKTFDATVDYREFHIVSVLQLSMLAQVSPTDFARYLAIHLEGHSFKKDYENYIYVNEGKRLLTEISPSQNVFSSVGLEMAATIVLEFAESIAPFNEQSKAPIMTLEASDTRKCYRCSEQGHLARQCPKGKEKKAIPTRSGSSWTPRSKDKESKERSDIKDSKPKVTCSYCKKPGHLASTCRKRIKSESADEDSPATKRRRLDSSPSNNPLDQIMAVNKLLEATQTYKECTEAVGADRLRQMLQAPSASTKSLTPVTSSRVEEVE